MVVCLCQEVTEKEIKQAIHEEGVHTVKGLRKALGIAKNCGACAAYAHECIKKECNKKCASLPLEDLPRHQRRIG